MEVTSRKNREGHGRIFRRVMRLENEVCFRDGLWNDKYKGSYCQ